MPQMAFWSKAIPTTVRWEYRSDPTDPEGPTQLSITLYDQGQTMMEHASVKVPFNVTHELVEDALMQSWQGFLFGEEHAAPRALTLAARRWSKWSNVRASQKQ